MLATYAIAQGDPVAISPPTSSEIRTRLGSRQAFNAEATGMLLDYIGKKPHVNVLDLMDEDDIAAALSDSGLDADDLWAEALEMTGESGLMIWPAGQFNFSSTLHINKRLHVVGQAFQQQANNTTSNRPTRFVFAADLDGIVIHRYDTDGNTTGSNGNSPAGTDRGDGSIIQGIGFVGGGGSNGHGIWMRARATLINCSCSNFAENGLHIKADVSNPASEGYGNANDWIVRDCKFYDNRGHGMYVDGGDANAGAAYSVNAQSNDKSGIYESSFLGNIYVGCHTATNGKYARCFNSGRRFQATEFVDSTTEPVEGMNWLDGDPWEDIGIAAEHAIYPQWQSGQPYEYNSGYVSDGASSRNCFIGCYSENDQADCLMTPNDLVLGGLQVAGIRNAFFLDGKTVKSSMEWAVREDDTVDGIEFRIRSAYNQLLNWTYDDDHAQGISLGINGAGNYAFYHGNLSSRTGLAFLSNANDLSFGRSAPGDHTPGTAQMPLGVILGATSTGRHMTYAASAPASGYHARGDIVLNNAPTAGGSIGWVCVTAGDPGTWKTFGSISP